MADVLHGGNEDSSCLWFGKENGENLIHINVWKGLVLGLLAYLARFKKALVSHLRSAE